jgi:hypothetical protein
MKRILFLLLPFCLLLPSLSDAKESSTQTLTGEYKWSRSNSDPGEIKAIFTPTGPDEWQVAFHFDFRGNAWIFSGTAKGSLQEGALSGEVQDESKGRTFTFTGKVREGIFEGTHAEIEDGYPEATGSMTLGS